MTKYNEDKADNQINNTKLQKMFNISTSTLPSENDIVEQLPENLKNDPDNIILNNIDRANRLLDKIEGEIENGGSARMYEVSAQMINAVTTASSSIVGSNVHMDELEYKNKVLELKEREVAIKEALGVKKTSESQITNNLIVADRESLLNIINDKKENQNT